MMVSNAQELLIHISADSTEAMISQNFVTPLLAFLGYDIATEVYSSFPTSSGSVDFAVRSNQNRNDIFTNSRQSPEFIIEVKGQKTGAGAIINLAEGSTQYLKTVAQLKRYLLTQECSSAKFGILTNGKHIQLWRKHHKVIHPASTCHEMTSNNISDVIEEIKKKIQNPIPALVIAIYNNQGGVGKTTTVTNLAALLSCYKKKVLIIDFDPQQGDLSHGLGLNKGQQTIIDCLVDKNIDPRSLVQHYQHQSRNGTVVGFDVIPADPTIADSQAFQKLQSQVQRGELRFSDLIQDLRDSYDYILIDAPPNWQFFSKSAVAASDVVLIPARHSNLFSLRNAATAISKFIPETQRLRGDGGPIALPIFFNNGRQTEASLAISINEIKKIIYETQSTTGFNLIPYFFPNYTQALKDTTIFEIPSHAYIANSTFTRVPAAYKFAIVHAYYKQLVQEYFL